MHDGYWALLLCILTNTTTEQAFAYIETGSIRRARATITEDDIEEMRNLKQTMTYTQVGELFGLKKSSVFKYVKGHQTPRQRRLAL